MKLSPRTIIQIISAVLTNGYIKGFAEGKIYTGASKAICLPVLNCYSCPGALGSCPIGALQNSAGMQKSIPFYALGTLALCGVLLGRAVCGLLCPFGFIQDLLSKIPLRKVKVLRRADKALKYIKYGVLALFVLLLPGVVASLNGYAPPYFCAYICPAGTLEAGLPLLAADPVLRSVVGALFSWKFALLLAIILACLFIPRAFCRYLCPLGAFYSLFNKFSYYRMSVNHDACINCNKCVRNCPMQTDVLKDINSADCIRCDRCSEVCPTGAISSPLTKLKNKLKTRSAAKNG